MTKYKTVTKIDYFGTPYEVLVIDEPQKDLGKLWSGFRQQFLKSIENGNQLNKIKCHSSVPQSWYQRETEKQLSNDQK